jgi:RNA polymerase sigma-70 factor (ECF subfamily)
MRSAMQPTLLDAFWDKEPVAVVRRTRVQATTEIALEALYARDFRLFVSGALAIVGEPECARDVVQESFARALDRAGRFRGDGPLEAWVWRIVVNHARDVAVRERRSGASAELLEELAATVPADVGVLRDQLRSLPERQRAAVFLHYWADLPYDEIASLLGIASGTVAASLHAARVRLRKRLKEVYE